jgi:hypothetical protein
MTRPIIAIHNAETGEFIEREMNDSELADYETNKAADLAAQTAATEKAKAKAALLAKLGITAEEATLLLL